MARSTIEIGTTPNDGTGDTLRDAGTKINHNFAELYERLGGDSSTSSVSFLGNDLVFAGGVDDGYETKLSPVEPTADNIISIPNSSGTLVLTTATQTLTNKTLTAPVMSTPKITGGSYQYQFAVGSLAANRTVTLPTLTANDTFTFNGASQTLTNKTLTSPIITASKMDYINDTNGARMIDLNSVSSAVNHFSVTNAVSGSGVTLAAHTEGTDSDIDLNLNAYGQGSVKISQLAYGTKELNGTNSTTFGKSIYFLNKTSAFSVSVTDGNTVGEVRHFIVTNPSTGAVTLDFINKAGTDPVVLSGYGDTLSVIWDGNRWFEFASTAPIPASSITYDNTTSGLTATDVQAAIDEVTPTP